ncbi:Nramp family divalent metal transporter [Terriglobus roseus]|uniref:Manganese transport protein n=1 Tax=Terriglobus roseus TaxID=392734 RepID=A0A1G7N774_9BACT|nr:Nramp family divalent metal transporter [Terriglobus roseus]SDF69180.1 manganese transport protein [Terriglobus roseus]
MSLKIAIPEEKAEPRITLRELWTFFGPAFVASVAYIDPGNFASNIVGGAKYGYTLLWVLLWSNAMAMLVQYLSAKLGIATGHTLPECCREHFSKPVVWLLWVGAEISAIATDLAEFLGAALGFYLLVGPYFLAHGMSRTTVMFLAALATTVFVFLLLALKQRGFRHFEGVIIALVSAIGFCYAIEIFLVHPDWSQAVRGTLVPHLNHETLYIAVAMLGATVMPHVIYLHSSLMQPRLTTFVEHGVSGGANRAQAAGRLRDFRRRYLRFERIDIIFAMNGAWLINSAMLIMAAAALGGVGEGAISKLEGAHQTLGPLLGPMAQVAFAVALLCSGLSSSTIGVLAGQVVIEGFLHVKFPIYLRRLITIIPALVVIAMGLDELKVLLLSQAVLSFGIPFALVPLLMLTGKKSVMGEFCNNRATAVAGWTVAMLIIGLNCVLLWQMFTA